MEKTVKSKNMMNVVNLILGIFSGLKLAISAYYPKLPTNIKPE